jgi:hypothetical protein
MSYRRPNYEPTAYDDDWEDIPASGPIAKWFGGMIVPLALIAYGITCIITQHGIVGSRTPLELHGMKAVALGIATVSIALFLHCHYFWGNIYHLSAWAVLGKIVSLIAFIGSIGYLLWYVGVLGKR